MFHHNFKNDQFMNDYIFHNKENGYFVEIGACDGITQSQCYHFEKHKNWEGIAVEPQRFYHSKIKNNRKNFCDKAIGNCVKTLKFVEIPNKRMCSGIVQQVDLLEDKRNFKIQSYRKQDIEYDVEMIPLVNLLDEYNSPDIIDFIGIDAEGCELIILEHFFENNTKYTVGAFSLETNETDLPKMKQILFENDYVEVTNPLLKDVRYKNKPITWEKYFIHKSIVDNIDQSIIIES
jgi:FkbM family methyltransferase